MTIGTAWNVDSPDKPWAMWDRDAKIGIPIGLKAWLVSLGATYGSHEIITASPLQCVSAGTYANDEAGTVVVLMDVIDGAIFKPGKYPFTVRVKGSDGVTQDDRTFYLKLMDR